MQFQQVIGQQKIKQRLISGVKENRVSHAQLFLGPEGSGNLAIAIAYAQYLVCEKPGDTDSCGQCSACIKMNKLVHPDVSFSYPVAPREKISKPKSVDFVEEWRKSVIDNPYINFNDWVEFLDIENKQGIIAVEESADILRRLSLKSVESGYKIVIIWLPEKLHISAANKLLKIIEEPPDQTIFILVAENHEQILTTISSRTQLIKINRIDDVEMLESLMTRHSLQREAAKKIVHRADGNYREALRLLTEDTEEDDDAKLFLEWMRHCLKANVGGISEFSESMTTVGREKQKMFLKTALHIARECLLMNYADHSMVRLEGEELEAFKKFAPFINRNNAEEFLNELNQAHFHLERNANTKILFTDLSFKMNHLLHVKA
jgi:DNA polymerase-3 subunit delta'